MPYTDRPLTPDTVDDVLIELATAPIPPWCHDPADRPPGQHRAPAAGLRWLERLRLSWPAPRLKRKPAPASATSPTKQPHAAPKMIQTMPAPQPVAERPAVADSVTPPANAVQWSSLLAQLSRKVLADPVAAGVLPRHIPRQGSAPMIRRHEWGLDGDDLEDDPTERVGLWIDAVIAPALKARHNRRPGCPASMRHGRDDGGARE